MKRQRLLAAASIILCFMMLLPSCGLHKKQATEKTEEEEEELEDEEDEEDDDKDPSSGSAPRQSRPVHPGANP